MLTTARTTLGRDGFHRRVRADSRAIANAAARRPQSRQGKAGAERGMISIGTE